MHKHYKLIYFGGNAEDVSGNLTDAENYNVREIYFRNLSGYGNSTGKSSETSFYKNGLDVYDYIITQENAKPDSIILMGRSLGSAVALYVNAKRAAKALLFVTPFDKLSNLVPSVLKRLFPTSLLLKHKFDNLSYLDSITNKILILAASHDEVTPAESTMALDTGAIREETARLLVKQYFPGKATIVKKQAAFFQKWRFQCRWN